MPTRFETLRDDSVGAVTLQPAAFFECGRRRQHDRGGTVGDRGDVVATQRIGEVRLG